MIKPASDMVPEEADWCINYAYETGCRESDRSLYYDMWE